jgi:hypothetical protein
VAFGSLPDGRVLLASGSYDRLVRLWDPATGTPASEPLHGHTNRVTAVTFGQLSNGEALLASASDDDTVRLWHGDSGLSVSDPLTSVPSKPAVVVARGPALFVGGSNGLVALDVDGVIDGGHQDVS